MTLTPVVTNVPTIVLESTKVDSIASTLEAIDTNDPSAILEDCGGHAELPPPEVPVISDALVASKLVFMDSMSAGIAQSFGDFRGDGGIRQFGRYDDITGTYDYFETGGKNGGGYVVSTINDGRLIIRIASGASGRYYLGTNETPPTQGGITTIHDLRGKTISGPTPLQTLGNHAIVEVMPNHTLRVVAFDTITVLGTPTAFTVPSTGWFSLESYIGVAPALLTSGGFVISNLYVPGGPTIGVPIIRSTGVNSYNGSSGHDINDYFIHIPQNTGYGGFALHGPYGTVKRWMYDLILTNGWPTAPGDKTESFRTYEHYEPWGLELDGVTVVNFGPPGGMHWGDVERWKNVRSKTHKAYIGDESLAELTQAGELSITTNRWLTPGSPFYPADSLDPVVRNTFIDEATDFYKTTIEDVGIVEIESIGTFALSGARSWREQAGGFLFPFNWWNLCGPHPYDVTHHNNFGWPNNFVQFSAHYGSCNAVHEQLIKTSAGDIIVTRMGVAMAGSGEWRAELGYTLGPDLMRDKDPSTNQRWLPNNLPQVGVRGSFALNDALDTPATGDDRWNQFDIGQLALDIAGRSQAITITGIAIQPPVAAFHQVSFVSLTGVLIIYDISVDFNGDTTTLISGIVSRIMDWGDGSSPQSLPIGVVAGVAVGQVTHNYNADGSTYIAKLTVVNSRGLTNFTTKTFVTTIGVITASFAASTDGGDLSGLTIDFVDASSITSGSIVSWLWNFGDGNTSTLQNPTHTYAGYGLKHVTLTVTGNHSQTDTTSQDIDVEAPVSGAGCPEFAVTPPADFVMGDAFDGSNPPLPAYANVAAFKVYYWDQSIFREVYDTPYANSINSFDLDFTNLFNGNPTLLGKFGRYAPGSPSPVHEGAGWLAFPTDDQSPTEHYYPAGSPKGPTSQWMRLRFRGETGIVNDPSANVIGLGLDIMACAPQGPYIQLSQRFDQNIYLDVYSSVGGVGSSTAHFIENGSTFFGRPDDKFGEVILRYVGDVAGNRFRVDLWIGEACTLEGTISVPGPAATFTTGWIADDTNKGNPYYDYFNWFFTPSDTINLKQYWVASHSRFDESLQANPYHLTLPP